MGGIAIDVQLYDKYFADTEDNFHIWKYGSGPIVYIKPSWRSPYCSRYFQPTCGNVYFPFRFKKRYKIRLVNEWV